MPIPEGTPATTTAKLFPIKWQWKCSICDTWTDEKEDIGSGEIVYCSRCGTAHITERNEKEWG